MLNNKKNIILVIGILIFVILFQDNIGIPCFFHELTGLYCPGCGITRAFLSLIKLDLYQAFRYNMLVIILLPFFAMYTIYKLIMKGNKKIPNFIWYFLLIITILFGILRNISAFSFLAPTKENLKNKPYCSWHNIY